MFLQVVSIEGTEPNQLRRIDAGPLRAKQSVIAILTAVNHGMASVGNKCQP